MMLVCPNCATSYRVEQPALGAGRSVRCVRCHTVWFAQPEAGAARKESEALATALVDAAEGISAPAARPASLMPASPEPLETIDTDTAPTVPDQVPAEIEAVEAAEPPATEVQAVEPAADYEDTAPSIAPVEQLAALPTALPDPYADEETESFAARRERLRAKRNQRRVPRPNLPATILALIAVIAALAGWREHIVRIAPQTASLYAMIGLPVNLRGLVFDSVKTTRDTQDGVPILVVEGTIGSRSSATVEVPRLRFAVRNAAGTEIYSWTAVPNRNALGPGEQLPFRSRLASPPADAQDITVRFFTRYDRLAGVH